MRLFVGITTSDLSSLLHKTAVVSVSGATAEVTAEPAFSLLGDSGQAPRHDRQALFHLAPHEVLTVTVNDNCLSVTKSNAVQKLHGGEILKITRGNNTHSLSIKSIRRSGVSPSYQGNLFVVPDGSKMRVILETDLESYVRGVLQSEIPASYHAEAIKAQAVTARTYAMHPRIDHASDQCNVCDSFLCCQYFAGQETISVQHAAAIQATAGQIITWSDRPILALFSSCAGGHTENYENCFSDPRTGAFPPPPLPYLKGVSEGRLPPGFSTNKPAPERALRDLYALAHPETDDAWASQFRWTIRISAEELESHMHHEIQKLAQGTETAPFVTPPSGGRFGQIKSFGVTKRGVAGTAIELMISTTAGDWIVHKELVIRSCFKTPDLKLARLRSARIFFDYQHDAGGALAAVDIRGLGFGHGVGLQQTGSEGLARANASYREIVSHYFAGTEITTV